MDERTTASAWPAWVHKRDGRLVPFEPDKISQALFAVTEALGHPDAFLARELTDGVLHFLCVDAEGSIPSTAQIADLVIKVVRELGQPILAQTFADYSPSRAPALPLSHALPPSHSPTLPPCHSPTPALSQIVLPFSPDDSPATLVKACLRAYSLNAVFARDLRSAREEGLIYLAGLEAPLQLDACVFDSAQLGNAPAELVETISRARHCAGRWLAIDGPEHGVVVDEANRSHWAADYARSLQVGLEAADLYAVVNLNCAAAPSWAEHLAEGPLFAAQQPTLSPDNRAALALELLEALSAPASRRASAPVKDAHEPTRIRIDWHLAAFDFAPDRAGLLTRLARLVCECPAVAFVFDRPKKAIALAEGLDRKHGGVLLTVGLNLPRFAELPGLSADSELFLQKLGSLTRLALSAASQKRNFLRGHLSDSSPLSRGFLLDRARLVVAPMGLDAVVRKLTGAGPCASKPAQDLTRRIVQRLAGILRQDGPTYHLDACLDGTCDFGLEAMPNEPSIRQAFRPGLLYPGQVAGLTTWDASAPPKTQLRQAGALHAVANMGTAAILRVEDSDLTPDQVTDLLHYAWHQTDVVRVRFLRQNATNHQSGLWTHGE